MRYITLALFSIFGALGVSGNPLENVSGGKSYLYMLRKTQNAYARVQLEELYKIALGFYQTPSHKPRLSPEAVRNAALRILKHNCRLSKESNQSDADCIKNTQSALYAWREPNTASIQDRYLTKARWQLHVYNGLVANGQITPENEPGRHHKDIRYVLCRIDEAKSPYHFEQAFIDGPNTLPLDWSIKKVDEVYETAGPLRGAQEEREIQKK